MSNEKITNLLDVSTPLSGAEPLALVQANLTKQVTVANLTAGRSVTGLSFSDSAGDVRSVPRSGAVKTANYVLSTNDIGQQVELNTGGNVTIPDGVFSTGDVVTIVNNSPTIVKIYCSITTAYIAGIDVDQQTISLSTRGSATVLFLSGTLCVITVSKLVSFIYFSGLACSNTQTFYSPTVAEPATPFTIIYNTALGPNNTVTFPALGAGNLTIDWGDGNTEVVSGANYYNVQAQPTHTYSGSGTYTVTATGSLFGIYSEFEPRLTTVVNWGNLGLQSLEYAFFGASNLTGVPNYILANITSLKGMFKIATSFNDVNVTSWDVSNVTNMEEMFNEATVFNRNISGWDVSNVTNMSGMFWYAENFNQNIGSWDVSSVTAMQVMFHHAYAFNQNIGSWDVTNVVNMAQMFQNATVFNQPITGWDVSSVTNMSGMFAFTSAFNQNISSWNVSAVTTMAGMFQNALAFDQPIGTWNTSNVTDMGNMFEGASSFNKDLDTWNVSAVTNMGYMFKNAVAFNRDLSSWITNSVTNMEYMFNGATGFNEDITTWNTANVINMRHMFNGATAFNQNISGWDTGNVLNTLFNSMISMFQNASSFNQNLSSWCVSNILSKPTNFDSGASSWTGGNATRPQWGTCPP